MDGDAFLPSEIARLVLGYLKETGCRNTYQIFLKECIHLEEYNKLRLRGSVYPTSIGGKSLVDMLQEYGQKVSEHQKAKKTQTYWWKKLDKVVHQLDKVVHQLRQDQEVNAPSFLLGKPGKFPSSSLRTSSTPLCLHGDSGSDLDVGLAGVSDNDADSSPSRCSVASESLPLQQPLIPVLRPKKYSFLGGCSDSGISGSHHSANSLQCSSPSLASAETSPGLEPLASSGSKVVMPQRLTLVTEGPSCSHGNLSQVVSKPRRGRPPKGSVYPLGHKITHITTPMKLNLPGVADRNSITMLTFPNGGKLLPAPKLIQNISENRTIADLTNIIQKCREDSPVKTPPAHVTSENTQPNGVEQVTGTHAAVSGLSETSASKLCTDRKTKDRRQRAEHHSCTNASEMDSLVSELPDFDTIDDSAITTPSMTPFSQPHSDAPSTSDASQRRSFLLSGTVDDTSGSATGPSTDRNRELSPPPSTCGSQDQLSTPVKNFLTQEVKDAAKNLSPRRKSQAPRRRSTGGLAGLIPNQNRVRTSPAASTAAEQQNTSSNDSFVSQGSQGFVPLIEELINSKDFATMLADNINRVTLKTDGDDTQAGTAKEGSPECSQMAVTAEGGSNADSTADGQTRIRKDSVDRITTEELEHLFMEEDTLNNIIDMTRNDPHFDTLFQMFHVDKNSFIEKEYGVSAPDKPATTAPLSFSSLLQTNVEFSPAVVRPTPAISSVDDSAMSEPTSKSLSDIPVSVCMSTSSCHASLSTAGFPASSVFIAPSSDSQPSTSSFINCLQEASVVDVAMPSAKSDCQFVQILYPAEDGQASRVETVEVISTPKQVQPKFLKRTESTDQVTDSVTFTTKAMEQLDDLLSKSTRSSPCKTISEVGTESLDGSESMWGNSSTKSTPTRIQPSRRVRQISTQSTPGKPADRKPKAAPGMPKLSTKKPGPGSRRERRSSYASSPAVSDVTVEESIPEEDEDEEERKFSKRTKKVGLDRIGKTKKTKNPWKIPMSDKRKYLGIAWRSDTAVASPSETASTDQSASLLMPASCDVDLTGSTSQPVQTFVGSTSQPVQTFVHQTPSGAGKVLSASEQVTPQQPVTQEPTSAKHKKKAKESGASSKKSGVTRKPESVLPNKSEIVPEFASTIDVSCLPLCSITAFTKLAEPARSVDNKIKQSKLSRPLSQVNAKKLNISHSTVPDTPTRSCHVRCVDISSRNQSINMKKQSDQKIQRATSENVQEQAEKDLLLSMPDTVDIVASNNNRESAGDDPRSIVVDLKSSAAPISMVQSHYETLAKDCQTQFTGLPLEKTSKTVKSTESNEEDSQIAISCQATDTVYSNNLSVNKTDSTPDTICQHADKDVAETLITLSTTPVVTPFKTPQTDQDDDTRDTIGFIDLKLPEVTHQSCDPEEASQGQHDQTSESNDVVVPVLRMSRSMSVMATTSAIIGSPPGVSGGMRVASKPAAMAARAADPGSSNSAEPSEDSSSSHSAHSSSNHTSMVAGGSDVTQNKVSFDGDVEDTDTLCVTPTPAKDAAESNPSVNFSPNRTTSLQKLLEHGMKTLKSTGKVVKLSAAKGSKGKSERKLSINKRQKSTTTGPAVQRSQPEPKPDSLRPGSVALRLTPVKRGSTVTLSVTVPTSPSTADKHISATKSAENTRSPFKMPQTPPPAKAVAKDATKQLVPSDTASCIEPSPATSKGVHVDRGASSSKDAARDTGSDNSQINKSAKRKRARSKDATDSSSSDGHRSHKKLKKSKQKDLDAIGSRVNLDNKIIDKILSKIHKG